MCRLLVRAKSCHVKGIGPTLSWNVRSRGSELPSSTANASGWETACSGLFNNKDRTSL